MGPMTDLVQTSGGVGWLLLPSALMLGILHGLEPGHSKTMMTALIIAVRGTATQAVSLGLAATVSHTSVVWLVALAGMYFGRQFDSAFAEPLLQMVSAFLIIAIALWMLQRTGGSNGGCATQSVGTHILMIMATGPRTVMPMSRSMPTRSSAG
jgi:nickel/cobalt exporter